VDVASIDIQAPQTNLILSGDGRTNIPEPKTASSGKPADQTILDLAIGRFGVQDGTFQVKAAGQPPKRLPWAVAGEKLRASLDYSAHTYRGKLSFDPLHANYGPFGPLAASVEMAVLFERDHLRVSDGKMRTAASHVEFSGDMRNLTAPEVTGIYTAHVNAEITSGFPGISQPIQTG
jgi:hypothetical protein